MGSTVAGAPGVSPVWAFVWLLSLRPLLPGTAHSPPPAPLPLREHMAPRFPGLEGGSAQGCGGCGADSSTHT